MFRLASALAFIAVAAGALTAGVTPSVASLTGPGSPTAGTSGAVAGDAPKFPSASCGFARQILAKYKVDRSKALSSGVVTMDGWTMDTRTTWIGSHPSNPAITQAFHSSAWVIPDTADGIPAAVNLLVDQFKRDPDPGAAGAAPGNGWNESQVTLRIRTVLCLYQGASPEDQARLRPVIDALVKANLDPKRYYGPPRTKPHNHGVMADRELLNVAALFGDKDLARKAETRLRMQMDGMYDSCGFMREQSSSYQHFHANLWNTVASRVVNPEFQQEINDQIRKIQAAAYAVTWPDGTIPTIGDSGPKVVDDLSLVSKDIAFNCPDTGWLSTRTTNNNGTTQQWIARFGPPTMLHGHADKGEVVWWVGRGSVGKPVLVDRGLPGKNRDARYEYATGPQAHPVLLWPGGSDRRSTARQETAGPVTMTTITTDTNAGTWTRVISTRSDKPVLVIRDVVGGESGSKPATSNLPLDPAWVPAAGKTGVFAAADGSTLTITCTTRTARTLSVATGKVQDFQKAPVFRDAYTASCKVPEGTLGVTATLTVTPAS